ncbi:MAG TPA: LuxR C-terminal-related transcriptional regulator [Candidatus Limnocylindrales bacterium]|nr:LuxR C-terminal-related transcriptional regulator [Candidatus Limnocylindrales bacterium]
MESSTEPVLRGGGSDPDASSRTALGRSSLPLQLSSFVGRARELEELEGRIQANRLVTLTGSGGSGKTRLAIEVAGRVQPRFRGGAFFVDLAATTDPGLVASTIATVVGVWEEPGQPVINTLAQLIGDERLVVVLDNLEQLPAATPLIGDLLARCPNLHVVATSRSPLHLRGENEYPVEPLALPTSDDGISLDRLRQAEAVALFVQRTQAISPQFALTEENARAITEICRLLDGLPLAIELAAAPAKLLGPQALLDRLEHHLPLLPGGATDAPARQRTLHDTISWSYDHLTERHKLLFARLSVFVGGCTLHAAEAVVLDPTDAAPLPDLLEDLARLVEQSVLRVAPDPDGEPRFSMLETIRDFALTRLAAGHEKEVIERRHAEAYVGIAEGAAQALLGDLQRTWLDRLELEVGNLRSALRWTIESGASPSASRLAAALWRFWQLRGHLSEGRGWLDRIIALSPPGDKTLERAMVLDAVAGVAYWQGDLAGAEVFYKEGLELRRALGEPAGIATALYNLSFVYFLPKTDLSQARLLLEESLAMCRDLSDRAGIGRAYWALSQVIYAGDDGSDPTDLGRAVWYNEQSQVIFREFDDRFSLGWALHWRGLMAISLGDLEVAHLQFEEGLRLFAGAGDVSAVTILLDDFSALAVAEGNLERAASLSGAAATLQRKSGADLASFLAGLYSRPRPEAAQLENPAIAKAWSEGSALSAEEAVTLALGAAGDGTSGGAQVAPARSGSAVGRGRHDLTAREREVFALVAAGRSDGEIGAALFITKKTASTHVANIKDKLGASSRVEIAMMANRP